MKTQYIFKVTHTLPCPSVRVVYHDSLRCSNMSSKRPTVRPHGLLESNAITGVPTLQCRVPLSVVYKPGQVRLEIATFRHRRAPGSTRVCQIVLRASAERRSSVFPSLLPSARPDSPASLTRSSQLPQRWPRPSQTCALCFPRPARCPLVGPKAKKEPQCTTPRKLKAKSSFLTPRRRIMVLDLSHSRRLVPDLSRSPIVLPWRKSENSPQFLRRKNYSSLSPPGLKWLTLLRCSTPLRSKTWR